MRDEVQIDIFESPERHATPHHTRIIQLPMMRPLHDYLMDNESIALDELDAIETVTVEAEIYSLHITQEYLEEIMYHCDVETGHNRTLSAQAAQIRFLAALRNISRRLYRETKSEQPEHFLRLDKVRAVRQPDTDQYLIELLIFRRRHEDANQLVNQFQSLIMCCLQTGTTDADAEDVERAVRVINNGPGPGLYVNQYGTWNKKFDKEAEKRALKLLEKMLSKERFKYYKDQEVVVVRGKSGSMYSVKKSSMIEVQPKKGKPYRLCIEARNHDICPTDGVIAKITLIKANEEELHKRANKFDTSFYTGISGVYTTDFRDEY